MSWYRPSRLTSRKQVVLVAEELSAVRLPEADNSGGIQPPGLGGAARGDTESQGSIVHAVDDDTLVFGTVLGPATDVRLDGVAAIQEGHRSVLLDPDLVARMLGNDGQRGDVHSELARLGELAKTGTEG